LNSEFFWTTVSLALAGFIIVPFYMGMLIAYERTKSKIHLEFLEKANNIEKKVKFDEAVERLFEEGVENE
jgi:hypothetical protein